MVPDKCDDRAYHPYKHQPQHSNSYWNYIRDLHLLPNKVQLLDSVLDRLGSVLDRLGSVLDLPGSVWDRLGSVLDQLVGHQSYRIRGIHTIVLACGQFDPE